MKKINLSAKELKYYKVKISVQKSIWTCWSKL